MKKVLFLTNIPSPYRVKFFDELGKNYDVTVLFMTTAKIIQAGQAAGLKMEVVDFNRSS